MGLNVAAVFLVFAAGLALCLGIGQRAGAAPSVAETYSQSARIKAATMMIPIGMGSAVFVSFQAETPNGVVMTQGGSNEVSQTELGSGYLGQNPKRWAMVDALRSKMQNAGWTELGVDGQWFEYVFGR
ncbi:hypothetical protein QGN32_09425 [Mycolicibacterium sp. ND9-15]|uniref:hypothetical protein n=1 Tax=Mycolicibacterium sp. ND9-15 TaxID=3042320 RepID=UPI002DDAFA3E|nr:hypothetical protein [Mycolicibacterium sp. ND9-15]WSE58041.1 hypothetical protein QGN32_09425 [Mycolicibacterium sp. ND9-15]